MFGAPFHRSLSFPLQATSDSGTTVSGVTTMRLTRRSEVPISLKGAACGVSLAGAVLGIGVLVGCPWMASGWEWVQEGQDLLQFGGLAGALAGRALRWFRPRCRRRHRHECFAVVWGDA